MKLVHKFKQNGYNFLLDVNSGSVHLVDDIAYDVLDYYESGADAAEDSLSSKYKAEDIRTAFEELKELESEGVLYTDDIFPSTDTFLEESLL